jgi:selenocysteine lyase/cysteine desulfurase
MSYCSAVGLSRSLALLAEAGAEALAEHSYALAVELADRVEPLGWTPFRVLDDSSACGHIVSLRHATLSESAIQATLAAEHGVIVGSRGGGIRVSLHGYNDSSDVAAIADALKELAR